MVRDKVLLWTCMVLLVTANVANGIGVNWGIQSSSKLLPSNVAMMILENGFDKVKLSTTQSKVLEAFAGTGIEVMIGIPNEDLDQFSGKFESAKEWVKENVTKYVKEGSVNIKYVAVGNEPFAKRFNNTYVQSALPALDTIQKALNHAGIGDKVKATIPFDAEVCKSETKGPSGGVFRQDIKDVMVKIVQLLNTNKAPFVLNMSPFYSIHTDPSSSNLNFAFFDNNLTAITDNKASYTNTFDVVYDTVVSALSTAGVPDLKVVVGEIGWPTDGDINANVKNAKRYYEGLVKKVSGNKAGTPLRPGHIDAYAFSLLDENNRSIARGPFERHWGIFTYDGKLKFSFDFTGKGREPEAVKGVMYRPRRWCVVSSEAKDQKELQEKFKMLCSKVDCTSLGYGSSCNNLDFRGNVSYALNMNFQMSGQTMACEADEIGKIVLDDPSKGDCVFPVQTLSVLY